MATILRMVDGVALTAQQERQAWAAVHGGGSGRQLGGRSGFRVGTPSNILTATSTTWTLGPCAAMIDPLAATHQGMYGWSSVANIAGTVTAADATYSRKDIVYIRVNDSSSGDGSGALNANVYYLAGAADGLNVAPTVPARGFLVGTISVPIAGGGSPTVALNPARYVAAGGILPVSSQAERDAITDKYDGFAVRRSDVTGSPVETVHAGSWYRQPVSVEHGLAVSDGFFTITGGLIKTVTAGLTQVTATLQLVRNTGPITISTADSPLLIGLIPAGFRPTQNHYFIATANNAIGARYAEPQLVIGDSTNGTLIGRSTSGGPITLDVGYTLFISTSWTV